MNSSAGQTEIRLGIQTSKLPLRDREGKVTGVIGIYEDITERKQAGAGAARE